MEIRWLGTMEYRQALQLQEDFQEKRIHGLCPDTLLLLEHPPVLTMGRRASSDNILISREALEQRGFSVVEINRGGDVTYHGPGQLVGYPIFDLREQGRDIRFFMNRLEGIFVAYLSRCGINAHSEDGRHTGVFHGHDKLVAFGISVRQWVTMHGFAFNVQPDLTHFSWILPCGLSDRGVTSVEVLTGRRLSLEQVARDVGVLFRQTFQQPYQDVES